MREQLSNNFFTWFGFFTFIILIIAIIIIVCVSIVRKTKRKKNICDGCGGKMVESQTEPDILYCQHCLTHRKKTR